MPSAKESSNLRLRNLPSVNEILCSPTGRTVSAQAGGAHTGAMIRQVVAEIRRDIDGPSETKLSKGELLLMSETKLMKAWQSEQMTGLQQVINATGVIIHTNLGRAPLSAEARLAVAQGAGYCTLEYDIEYGKRAQRGLRTENLLTELTGAESALIVNNCAAAAYFVLAAFAAGGEVVISRGEMVEIGGDFRVPDVLAASGAILREVGTTNRTKVADYEKVIGGNTRVLLRVHPSNYRIVGFTAMPSLNELSKVAHRHGVILYEDIGSGALIDLAGFGLADEPVVGRSIDAGVDIVTFSGDKLLGGPQAGIIAGKSEYIDRLRGHSLYRALRVDKLTYGALGATLEAYRRGTALSDIPVLQMLSMTKDKIAQRAINFVRALLQSLGEVTDLSFEISDGFSAIGGGAAPNVTLGTKLISLSHRQLTSSKIAMILRNADTPVITRIVDDRVVIDLRTVHQSDEIPLLKILLASF